MTAQRRAVVLVPYATHIEPACERGLRGLEQHGLEVRRYAAAAAVDRARSEMATAALDDGFDEVIWIDSDIAFDPDDVGRLRGHDRAIVAGLYAKKGAPSFAVYFEPGTRTMTIGAGGGLCRVRYVGLGFMATQRRVYDDVRAAFGLPRCRPVGGAAAVPYFLPMVIEDDALPGGYWYLGEDYAFCERARQAGHDIVVDTAIRLGHVGGYPYGWEDAVQPTQRVAGLVVHLPGEPGEPGELGESSGPGEPGELGESSGPGEPGEPGESSGQRVGRG